MADLLGDVREDGILAERLHNALPLGTAMGPEAAKIWWHEDAPSLVVHPGAGR